MRPWRYLWNGITRSKTVDTSTIYETHLKRSLNVVDLLGLGVGSTLGIGVYVIICHVAHHQAGPSVVISVLIAGVAALLSGLCYSEFSARLPRAGAAYFYSYVTVGELCGFVVGWNILLDYMIAAAAGGKVWGQYLDNILNNTIQRYLDQRLGWSPGPGMDTHPDVMALSIVLIATFVTMIGAKVTSVVSCVCSLLNVVVVACIICVGFFHVNSQNWTAHPGFFPEGITGILAGAATLFVAFLGFDAVATSSEECKDPSRVVPVSIVTTLIICFVLYFGVAMAITLAYPWYQLQDRAALPKAYEARQIFGSNYVIGIGGMLGLSAALFGCLYSISRIIYSMADDHILFKCLSFITKLTRSPAIAVFMGGLTSGTIAMVFKLETLIDTMAIGTLAAYTVVSISVLCLRYDSEIVGLYKEYEDISDIRTLRMASTDFINNTGYRTYKNYRLNRHDPHFYSSIDSFTKQGDSNSYINNVHQQNVEAKETFATQKSKSVICTELQDTSPMISVSGSNHSTYQRISSIVSGSSFGSLFQFSNDYCEPTERSWRKFSISLIVYIISSVVLCVLTIHGRQYVYAQSWWAIIILAASLFTMITCLVVIARQPKNKINLLATTPYVPVVPLASFTLNAYLITSLPQSAWLRFAVWLAIGLLVYFGYGIHKSKERDLEDQEVILYEIPASDSVTENLTTSY
ncbi:cationic amino acid transporter 3 isoform X1 [Octopus bimaculoides]|uniref:cationic amino acid transporter 3 isoform X1 n=1 Tax=Octopus bimaculoides TaxID=37653 RepID=UPI00071CC0C5|nr:cationic amino acid transporter 3 isoform X1 [Octopus bimaculoides]|eukprot:XP_014789344.1 PREDICTED: cationic amino acid transporter 3-like isoform X1 [Octopus bimaculoides]